MSKNHAKAYNENPRTTLVAAMDINKESAAKLSQEYSIPAVYTDYKELLEKEDLDIVSIVTWQGVRAEITIAAAESGVKGILGEKPMAACLGEADDMIEACEKHDAKLAIGHQGRFSPKNVEIRRLIQDGAIGATDLAARHARNPTPGYSISERTVIDGTALPVVGPGNACGSLAKRRAQPTSGNAAPVVKICAWGLCALKEVQGQYMKAICPNPLSPDRPFTALPGK